MVLRPIGKKAVEFFEKTFSIAEKNADKIVKKQFGVAYSKSGRSYTKATILRKNFLKILKKNCHCKKIILKSTAALLVYRYYLLKKEFSSAEVVLRWKKYQESALY